jgi:methyl-accepting chemotaxis protein
VKELVSAISLAGDDQAKGVNQIAAALTHLEQITQQTAATAHENASAGEGLQEQARGMREVVAFLEELAR